MNKYRVIDAAGFEFVVVCASNFRRFLGGCSSPALSVSRTLFFVADALGLAIV